VHRSTCVATIAKRPIRFTCEMREEGCAYNSHASTERVPILSRIRSGESRRPFSLPNNSVGGQAMRHILRCAPPRFLLALVFVLTVFDAARSQEHRDKASDLIKQHVPALRTVGIPPLVAVSSENLTRTFPKTYFWVLGFRQHPVAMVAPEPLKVRNLFVVMTDDKVKHIIATKDLEEFFRAVLKPVTDARSAKDCTGAWLCLSQELKQDGFFTFSIPPDSLTAKKSRNGFSASGKAVVTKGGTGEIRANLSFTAEGKLSKVDEASTVKAGIRPICQATKLLDPDPIVRQMAEKDILVMGKAAKCYLDEQRAKASPELKQAIDRVWQRILDEEW